MASPLTGGASSGAMGELLNTFVTHNRAHFPLLVRVTDWKEETSILENHVVRPGVELVVHGWTRQTKVLAKAAGVYYAVPLTYGGQFRVRVKTFSGAVQLWNARPKACLRVVKPDVEDPDLLSVGDLLRLKRPQDDDDDSPDGERRRVVHETKKFLRCERVQPGSESSTDFRIPLSCLARFEEVLDDFPANPDAVHIRELIQTLSHRDVEVELVAASPDRPTKDRDLPERTSILLSDNVTEQAVYVSVDSPTAPAFHLPLRTLIYVTVVRGLDKRCSPLLTKQAPKLSTLDRCVEILPPDVFDSLRPSQRSFESPDFVTEESRPTNKVMATPARYDASSEDDSRTSGYPGSLSITIKGSNVSQKPRKSVPPSNLPKTASIHHPVAYIQQPPDQPFQLAHQESHSSLSSYQNYQSQTLHPQTQTVQPQTQILQTQAQVLQPQIQYTQPQVQAVQPLALIHQPQFQTLESHTQTFQPHVQPLQPHLEFNQSQIQTVQPQVQFTQTFSQPLQAQHHLSQPHMQVNQPHLQVTQPQLQMTQPQVQMTQPQIQMTQPQMQMAQPQMQMTQPQIQMTQPQMQMTQPQMQVSQPQFQLSQPQMQLGQHQMHLGQPSMLGMQPQSQLVPQQVAMTQPHLQITQPQLQLTQPQTQWTQLQLSQPQIQMTQPQAQLTQPYQPVQLETQLNSPSTLIVPHPVFKKKGRAPAIPHTHTTQVQGTTASFQTAAQDEIQAANQWSGTNSVDSARWHPENQDAEHLQRVQQQQTEYSMDVPPGFGLVPLQSTNGLTIPPGFVLVPINSAPPSIASTQQPPTTNQKQVKFSHPGDDDDSSDDDVKPEPEAVMKKLAGFKLKIPDDGNLYELSSKRFSEFLTYLRIEPETMKTTKKTNLDGKKFAGLSEEDLVLRNLVNPVLMHFRRLTEKPQRKSFVL